MTISLEGQWDLEHPQLPITRYLHVRDCFVRHQRFSITSSRSREFILFSSWSLFYLNYFKATFYYKIYWKLGGGACTDPCTVSSVGTVGTKTSSALWWVAMEFLADDHPKITCNCHHIHFLYFMFLLWADGNVLNIHVFRDFRHTFVVVISLCDSLSWTHLQSFNCVKLHIFMQTFFKLQMTLNLEKYEYLTPILTTTKVKMF